VAIAPKEYTDYANTLEALVSKGRALGLWRTSEKVHDALNEARSETFEAMPRNMITLNIDIGPVTQKNLS
jgi:hypothetical protein